MRSLDSPQDFAETFDRYFSEIHGYIARRLGTGVADDIAAETFLIAYRKRASFDYQEGTVRAWLYGIATRLVSHHRRDELRAYRALQRAAAIPPTDDRMIDHTDRVTDRVAAAAVHRQLAAALAALSQGDRDVLLLVALADLTHAEVAAALDIPYGTVGSRLSRARRRLRAALGPQDTEDSQE
ncbi:MAG: polymerase subunit sigma-70 [Actinomycetia bacterium]|nr:polymerase subunit sigma-70 [Actinomycetes bacterium]